MKATAHHNKLRTATAAGDLGSGLGLFSKAAVLGAAFVTPPSPFPTLCHFCLSWKLNAFPVPTAGDFSLLYILMSSAWVTLRKESDF